VGLAQVFGAEAKALLPGQSHDGIETVGRVQGTHARRERRVLTSGAQKPQGPLDSTQSHRWIIPLEQVAHALGLASGH
jgi:hypothetical protein